MPVSLQKIETYGVRHCYIEYMVSSVLTYKRVWLSKKCEVKISSAKLEFSGDGQKYHKNYGYEAEGTIETALDDNTIDSIIYATPQTLPSGGDDFVVRYIKGGDTELQSNFVGLRISLDGEDVDTGAPLVVRYRILKVQFDPDTPPAVQTETAGGRMLSWSARRAKVAIDGTTPTGMPANGCFWLKDIITDTTKFDPVPGDVL